MRFAAGNRRLILRLILLSLAGLFLFSSCGRKGPLRLEDDYRPAPINDLRAVQRDGKLHLSWSRPAKNADGSPFRNLAAYVISRSDNDAPFRVIALLDGEKPEAQRQALAYVDETVQAGISPRYAVASRNTLKISSLPSNIAMPEAAKQAIPAADEVDNLPPERRSAPIQPTGAHGFKAGGTIYLVWDDPGGTTDLSGWRVCRLMDGAAVDCRVVHQPSYADKGAGAVTGKARYRLTALADGANAPESAAVYIEITVKPETE
jgi:predicted small lipoprotein YifL